MYLPLPLLLYTDTPDSKGLYDKKVSYKVRKLEKGQERAGASKA
jgi:hypothetical protein